MPPTLPPAALANRTIGEATSLSPGFYQARHPFPMLLSGSHLVIGIGDVCWVKSEQPGRDGMPPARDLVIPTLRKHARRYD